MSDLSDILKRIDPEGRLGKVREYRHSSNFTHPTDYIIRLADAALFEVLTEIERLKDMVFARETALEEAEAEVERLKAENADLLGTYWEPRERLYERIRELERQLEAS